MNPPDFLGNWLGVIMGAIALATIIYNWFTSGEKTVAADLAAHKNSVAADVEALRTANSSYLKEVEDATDALEKRVQKLESAFEYLPDKDSVHRLELTMKDMQVQMASMSAASEATARTARRVEEFLLDQAKRT